MEECSLFGKVTTVFIPRPHLPRHAPCPTPPPRPRFHGFARTAVWRRCSARSRCSGVAFAVATCQRAVAAWGSVIARLAARRCGCGGR